LETTPAQTGTDAAIGPVRLSECSPLPAVALLVPVPCVPQLVLLATTPAQTGAETPIGPVTLLECRPAVALAEPPVEPQVVSSATTAAQTGADAAIGPVTLFEPCVPVAVASPAELDESVVAPALLVFEQLVLSATTPAQIGAETAIGPVTPLDP
jgi:hypothetical protein